KSAPGKESRPVADQRSALRPEESAQALQLGEHIVPADEPEQVVPVEVPGQVVPAETAVLQATEYIVGVGDVLLITSLDDENLTGEYVVGVDGSFTYPYI